MDKLLLWVNSFREWLAVKPQRWALVGLVVGGVALGFLLS